MAGNLCRAMFNALSEHSVGNGVAVTTRDDDHVTVVTNANRQ